jgi:phosphoribosylaminoimidazole-succinocarboxamide synthase|tara:strand:- start:1504 stop:2403 length:900 start_codon:yes stop_codon:yes gene_type:complete
MNGITYTELDSLSFIHQGKVRDIYEVDADRMLIVTTDRLSAFDVIMNEPIPEKGRVLTAMANFWFNKFESTIPNHLTHDDPLSMVSKKDAALIKNRSIVVKKLKPIPIEAIVRGYVAGSGWDEYQEKQSICGISLPRGLKQAEKLPNPIFTPSSKADVGSHDENISEDYCKNLIGENLTNKISEISLNIYKEAYKYAYKKGIIIADTKFEFGLDGSGKLHIIDEILTPDSSRFWLKDSYKIGESPASYDKQFVRDWLASSDWDKDSPPPILPQDIIEKTSEKYQEALFKLTGLSLISSE